MFTSCSVLLLAAGAVIINDMVIYSRAMVKNLEITAGIIGFNSAAAITFDDRKAAAEALTSLDVEPHIVTASIYGRDGILFADYTVPNTISQCTAVSPGEKDYQFEGGYLVMHKPIRLDGEVIGTLCLQSDLLEMNSAMKRIVTVVALILLVAFSLAMVLSSRLQKIISDPILQLARTAEEISREKNYTIRAQKTTDDEIGILIDGFNEMLTQVQHHDRKLEQHRDKLEAEVNSRTRELRESEERFRQLAQATFEAVIIHTENTIIEVNQAFTDMFGYSRGEGLKMKILDFIVPGEQGKVKEILRTSSKSIYETTGLRKDGSTFRAEVCVKSANYQGTAVQVKAVRDISERKRMEEELLKARKLESIGVLAGGIAHDFNNFLTAILGNISLIRATTPPDDSRMTGLRDAENACLRAKDLSGQLLTFSKGGAPVKKITALDDIIKESVDFSLRGANVKSQLELDPDLRAADIDAGQISQVINNLVINACQAMPEGGNISVRADNVTVAGADNLSLPAGNYLKISIQDHGIGIRTKHLNKIFDPYFTTKQAGSGLGLASCYSIIKQHNGMITVNSQPDEGTVFVFYLPAADGEEQRSEAKQETLMHRASGKILVMDDEEMVRTVSGALLNKIGYQVEFAADGREAVEKYEKSWKEGSPFDVVIMDLTIPGGMGGKEAMQHLLAINPDVKGIVSSGYANDPVMADFGRYGFSSVVTKPYILQQLSDALAELMQETGRDQGKPC